MPVPSRGAAPAAPSFARRLRGFACAALTGAAALLAARRADRLVDECVRHFGLPVLSKKVFPTPADTAKPGTNTG